MSTDEGREPSARWEFGAFCFETIETLPAVLSQVLSHAPHPAVQRQRQEDLIQHILGCSVCSKPYRDTQDPKQKNFMQSLGFREGEAYTHRLPLDRTNPVPQMADICCVVMMGRLNQAVDTHPDAYPVGCLYLVCQLPIAGKRRAQVWLSWRARV